MDSSFALGVDIGGSHIVAALVNTETGVVLPETQYRSFVNSAGNANEIIDNWAAAIRQSWALAGVSSSLVGIAMPGPFDYENGICLIAKQEKYQALYGMNIKILLAEKLGLQPMEVRFINDASSFLKGELIAGSLKGLDNAVGITLGTGLGSAYYTNNELADAELWRMPFKAGIAEDYLSTRWFINEYEYRYHKVIKGVKEVTETTVEKNEAVALFDNFAANLADFVMLLNTRMNCNNVVIGGNITKAASYFWDDTCRLLEKNNCPAKLSVAKLGEMAAIIGAATLFEKESIIKN
jgi:glucokinase